MSSGLFLKNYRFCRLDCILCSNPKNDKKCVIINLPGGGYKVKNISGGIADVLFTQGVIQSDDIDKCKYGIDLFISSFLEIFSILIIAVFGGNFIETVLLFVFFIPLRIYAGGYHADTKMKCYLISLMMYGFSYVIASISPCKIYSVIDVCGTVFSLIVVLIKAPIIHDNKRVNDIERKNYRKISIEICLLETMIILLLTILIPEKIIVTYLMIGQVSVALSMLAAMLKKHITGK